MEQTGIIKHLEHPEDLIFTRGKKGFQYVRDILLQLLKYLKGETKDVSVSVKVDGSPAVIFGADPRSGRNHVFFVGTKSVLSSKEPKLAHDEEEIKQLYESPGLARKLTMVYQGLKPIYRGDKIYQGDLLFVKGDRQIQNIEGKNYVVFTPNVITYGIPEDSVDYKPVCEAVFGMVLHTTYQSDNGLGFDSPLSAHVVKSSPKELIGASRNRKIFMVEPPRLSSETSLDEGKTQKTLRLAESKLKRLDSNFDSRWISDRRLTSVVPIYINNLVKVNPEILTDPSRGEEFFHGLLNFIDQRKESEGIKTNLKEYLNSVKPEVVLLFEVFALVSSTKNELIAALNQSTSRLGQEFFKTENGYTKTNPEGFVITSKGRMIKLVDRSTFSRFNFTTKKPWAEGTTFTRFLEQTEGYITTPGKIPVSVVLGRFVVPHLGHLELFKMACKKTPFVIVAVVMGKKSSQDKTKNPTSFDQRERMIDAVADFDHKVISLKTGFLPELINTLRERGYEPTVLLAGPDRLEGYQQDVEKYRRLLNLKMTVEGFDEDRVGDLSGTDLRQVIRLGNKKKFREMVPKKIYPFWAELRRTLEEE